MILVAHFYLAIAQNVKRFGRFWWNKSSIVCRIEMTGSFPGGSSVVGHPANLLLLSSVNNSHATQRKYPPIIIMFFFLAVALVNHLTLGSVVSLALFSEISSYIHLHTLAQHKTWIRGCEDGVEDRQGGTKTVFSSPHRMSPTLSPTPPPPPHAGWVLNADQHTKVFHIGLMLLFCFYSSSLASNYDPEYFISLRKESANH